MRGAAGLGGAARAAPLGASRNFSAERGRRGEKGTCRRLPAPAGGNFESGLEAARGRTVGSSGRPGTGPGALPGGASGAAGRGEPGAGALLGGAGWKRSRPGEKRSGVSAALWGCLFACSFGAMGLLNVFPAAVFGPKRYTWGFCCCGCCRALFVVVVVCCGGLHLLARLRSRLAGVAGTSRARAAAPSPGSGTHPPALPRHRCSRGAQHPARVWGCVCAPQDPQHGGESSLTYIFAACCGCKAKHPPLVTREGSAGGYLRAPEVL